LADEIDAAHQLAPTVERVSCGLPSGPLNEAALAASLVALMPDDTIIIDESITSGRSLFHKLACGPRHDWLQNIGGAIGMAMPMAIGASIASPGRRVVCLEGDGSAMYSIQALWTHAREQLPITTILFANNTYAILYDELANVGADVGASNVNGLVDIGNPRIDWTSLARSLGVPAVSARTAEDFNVALRDGFSSDGPSFIEVLM
jgi:acetolactate synthase I/II/III large subunit